ncbi:MAG: HlyD family type I secretion periplasmic adaptor subunit [Magnetococcus sp. WYHC-3]
MNTPLPWREREYARDLAEARSRGVHPMAHALLALLVAFCAVMGYWAHQAELEEVTRGMGKVIPSSQVQVVQNLEGGILSRLEVAQGDAVSQGQVLLHIDATQFMSDFKERRTRQQALQAEATRLLAEAEGGEFAPSAELLREQPHFLDSERQALEARRQELAAQVAVLRQQVAQREQEITEIQASQRQIGASLALAQKELAITRPLVGKGVMSEVELLRLEREVNELSARLENSRLALPRAASALEEARRKATEPELTFRSHARARLSEVRGELAELEQGLTALDDRVMRTAVRSPVNGTVIQVKVNTIGQVLRAGQSLVEILPRDDSLLIEARISPADIGFLRPQLPTMVRFTAYDFSIYGGLKGTLEHISADTIVDEQGNRFFQIQVRTRENHLGTADAPLPVLPGMEATVDILTGRKTVLDYLLKPFIKTRERALRER